MSLKSHGGQRAPRRNVLQICALGCSALFACSGSPSGTAPGPEMGGTTASGGSSSTSGAPGLGGAPSSAGQPGASGGTAGTGTGGAPGGSAGNAGSGAIANGGAPAGGSTSSGAGGAAAGTAGSTNVAGSAGAPAGVPLDPALLSRCTGTNPIVCTLPAPNGNYDLTVEVGDAASAASSQIAAETRHFLGPLLQTAAGAFARQTITVNVRPEVHDGGQSAPANFLDVTISGTAPKLHGLGFRSAPSAVTLFVASDSTAADWVSTNTSAAALAPDVTGWAQELSMYLLPGVAVANYADSGETASTFYTKFFPPARTAMKAGDYLFIQFGHNDQKVPADVTNYQANLLRYVTDARAKNVTPVIVTPVSRSSGTAADPGFLGLDQLARDLAAQQNIALIDFTALSRAYYATLPNKAALFIDGTHFHEGGAVAVASVMAQAIKASSLPLKSFVR